MSDLPLNGRNAFQLAVLTAGAVETDAGTVPGQQDNGGLAVNGLRSTQNNWELDGAPTPTASRLRAHAAQPGYPAGVHRAHLELSAPKPEAEARWSR